MVLLKGFSNKTGGFSIWQLGNHAKECVSEEFTFEKIDYIHQNPIQSQIVRQPEDYLFSSAIDYLYIDFLNQGGRSRGLLLIDYI